MTRAQVLLRAALKGLVLSVLLYYATLAFYRSTTRGSDLIAAFFLSYGLSLLVLLLFGRKIADRFPREFGLVGSLALPALVLVLFLFLVDVLVGYLANLPYFRTIEIPVVALGQLWCYSEYRHEPGLYPNKLDRVLLFATVAAVAIGVIEFVLR